MRLPDASSTPSPVAITSNHQRTGSIGKNGASDKGPPEKDLQHCEHQQRDEKRDQHTQRQIDKAEMEARADVRGVEVDSSSSADPTWTVTAYDEVAHLRAAGLPVTEHPGARRDPS